MYSTTSLDAYILYIAMILCCLFGKNNLVHFLVEWVDIMNELAKCYTFNWEKMLSNNLTKEIDDYQSLK
jgi:hypothetical protein